MSDFSDGCSVLAEPWASAFVMPKNNYASLSLKGATGSVSGTLGLSADGASFTASWSHPAPANLNFSCAEAQDLRWHYYEFSYCTSGMTHGPAFANVPSGIEHPRLDPW